QCGPIRWDGQAGWEPLAVWHYYAKRARATLILASLIREQPVLRGDAARRADEMVGPIIADLAVVLKTAGREKSQSLDHWQTIVSVLNEWLAVGDVRPRLLVSESTRNVPQLVLTSRWRELGPDFPLFGVLGMQLAFAVM